jgi:hypothetical protein
VIWPNYCSLIASRDKDEEFEILQGLTEIESVFIKPPTLFLRLIIGNISVTLPHREDRFTALCDLVILTD